MSVDVLSSPFCNYFPHGPLLSERIRCSPMAAEKGFRFEIVARDTGSKARVGKLFTAHGVVDTPVFMPVGTAASVKGLTQPMMEELGADLLLANTYHLFLRPGHETIRELGGLHRFMDWDRTMLTDSGGFQVFSMNDIPAKAAAHPASGGGGGTSGGAGRSVKVMEEGVEFRSHLDGSAQFLSPEKAVEIQTALGADIVMVLDECLEHDASEARARESMELTLRWAKRSQQAFEKERERAFHSQALFGIVQGGMHPELRRECATRLVGMDLPGYAIGGLAVGEPAPLSYEMAAVSAEVLPEDKPRYVMGVGYPRDIIEYVRRGADMMDCVLPTRNGRNGKAFTSAGTVNLRNASHAADSRPIDDRCGCFVCRRHSRAYLRHLFNASEITGGVLASYHNLYYYLDLMRRIRNAILAGTLDDLAAELPAHREWSDPDDDASTA